MRLLLLSLVVAFLLAAAPAFAQSGSNPDPNPGPHGIVRLDFDHVAPDGTVLKATRWAPDGKDGAAGPWPAILTTHGWPGRHDTGATLRWGEHAATNGYVAVAWTARGFGDSGGETSLNGPLEVADARSLVDLLASDPDVLQDGPGDPRVGMVGLSYGGGIQLLAAQDDPRIDALVPVTTWNNLLQSLAPNDVFKLGWTTLLYSAGMSETHGIKVPPGGPGDVRPNAGGAIPQLTKWYLEAVATSGPSQELRHEVGVVRSLRPGAVLPPTLFVQGWPDTLFPADEALDVFLPRAQLGTRLILYPGGHGGFYLPWDHAAWVPVQAEIDAFFDTHLKGQAPALPPYPVLRYRSAEQDYVGELRWPPAGTQALRLHLAAPGEGGLSEKPAQASGTLTVTPAATACAELPNFQAQQGGACRQSAPGTVLTWLGPDLSGQELTGTPVLRLKASAEATSDARLLVSLLDVGPDGATPILFQQAAYKLDVFDGATAIRLPTVTHTFADGHRLALRIASSDAAYKGAQDAGRVLFSGEATLDVPLVPKDAWGDTVPPTIQIRHSEVRHAPDAPTVTHCWALTVADNLWLRDVEAELTTIDGTHAAELLPQPPAGCPSEPGPARYVTATNPPRAAASLRVTARDAHSEVAALHHAPIGPIEVGPEATLPTDGGERASAPAAALAACLLALAAVAARAGKRRP